MGIEKIRRFGYDRLEREVELFDRVLGVTIGKCRRVAAAVAEDQVIVALDPGGVIDVVLIPSDQGEILKGVEIRFDPDIAERPLLDSRFGLIP